SRHPHGASPASYGRSAVRKRPAVSPQASVTGRTPATQYPALFAALRGTEPSVLPDGKSAHRTLGIVREADSVAAVRRAQPALLNDLAARVARDHGAVDRALDAVVVDADRDFLGDRLTGAGGLVHGFVRLAAAAVQLEGLGAEAAH